MQIDPRLLKAGFQEAWRRSDNAEALQAALEEKGYFLFGGSTVIVYGEAGAWEPDADLIARTNEGMESLVRLGEPLARALI